MYLHATENKSVAETSKALNSFLKYLFTHKDQIKLPKISKVIADKGNEFRGNFMKILEDENIKIRVIDPDKLNHNSLAPLNSMCRYVRQQIDKMLIQISKERETAVQLSDFQILLDRIVHV